MKIIVSKVFKSIEYHLSLLLIRIMGLLLLINPDIEIISVVGTVLMIIGIYPLGIKTLRHE